MDGFEYEVEAIFPLTRDKILKILGGFYELCCGAVVFTRKGNEIYLLL